MTTHAVICPLHGFKFNLASEQPVENACQALKTYTINVTNNGDLLLTLDESYNGLNDAV